MKTFAQIMAGLSVLRALSDLINTWIANARQTGELTAEEEAKVRAEQDSIMATAAHWKPSDTPPA